MIFISKALKGITLVLLTFDLMLVSHFLVAVANSTLTIAVQDDALCIAAISYTYPDGDQSVVYGDAMAKLCDWPSYLSITDFPLPGVGPTGYKPYCFWLDRNDPAKKLPKSVYFHIPDFRELPMSEKNYAALDQILLLFRQI